MNLNLLIAVPMAIAAVLLTLTYVRLRRPRARSRGVAQPTPVRGEVAAGQPAVPEIVMLGGRRFRYMGNEASIEWDEFTIGALTRAGLIPLPDLKPGESNGDFGLRLLLELLAHRELGPIVGAFLVPDEIPAGAWSPDLAAETGRFVMKLNAPDDRRKIHNLTVSVLLDFFVGGTASSLISLGSLSPRETQRDGPVTESAPSDRNGQALFAT